jgi:hypothetical protein
LRGALGNRSRFKLTAKPVDSFTLSARSCHFDLFGLLLRGASKLTFTADAKYRRMQVKGLGFMKAVHARRSGIDGYSFGCHFFD